MGAIFCIGDFGWLLRYLFSYNSIYLWTIIVLACGVFLWGVLAFICFGQWKKNKGDNGTTVTYVDNVEVGGNVDVVVEAPVVEVELEAPALEVEVEIEAPEVEVEVEADVEVEV